MNSGLYIHIPFCHSKCAYCDFYSEPRKRISREFVDALCHELRTRLSEWHYEISTVYLGGGTPSSLPDSELHRIISTLPTNAFKEFTIEVNPEDVTLERAEAWLAMGIDRVSMGIQSLDDSILAVIGRRHDSATAISAYETLRQAGFLNISLDLIYGLPGDTLRGWDTTLARTLELRPEHLSAYSLSYEPGTRLYAMLQAGKITETPAEIVEQMYMRLCDAARQAGYEHYEISNFALPGHRAIHNSHYWDMTPYLGIGPGAHSFDGGDRYSNRHSVKDFIATQGLGIRVAEHETPSEKINDMIFTALRTADGLNLNSFSNRFGSKAVESLLRSAARHIRSGNLIKSEGVLIIPPSRWLVSNDIISDLMEV